MIQTVTTNTTTVTTEQVIGLPCRSNYCFSGIWVILRYKKKNQRI
ncbi:hypothetical protein [Methanobacterium sp.]